MLFENTAIQVEKLLLQTVFGGNSATLIVIICLSRSFDGVLHLLPQTNMFCTLFQNYQHHLEKQCMYLIDEMTADVTAGQNKLSEQKIALQYACTLEGPVV